MLHCQTTGEKIGKQGISICDQRYTPVLRGGLMQHLDCALCGVLDTEQGVLVA